MAHPNNKKKKEEVYYIFEGKWLNELQLQELKVRF